MTSSSSSTIRIVSSSCAAGIHARKITALVGKHLMRAGAQGWTAAAFAVLAAPCAALASDDRLQPETLQGSLQQTLPAYLRQMTDWGGLRSKLEQQGLKFTFTYYGDGFANPAGGVKEGFGYDGRFGTIVDADLDKLWGWSGATFHASIHQIHGTQYSATNLDNLMTVSGVEAPPSTRLFNLWIEQTLGDQVNLRLGQFTAAQEFMVSDNANLFLNATFGWPRASRPRLAQRRSGLSGGDARDTPTNYTHQSTHLARCSLQRRSGRSRKRQSGRSRSLRSGLARQ